MKELTSERRNGEEKSSEEVVRVSEKEGRMEM